MCNQVRKPNATVLRGFAVTLVLLPFGGCGKSADEIAAQDKETSERAAAAAQAEFEADQKKLRQIARGELRVPSVRTPPQEPIRDDAPTPPPAEVKAPPVPLGANAATAAAPRTAESVFAEVASSVP